MRRWPHRKLVQWTGRASKAAAGTVWYIEGRGVAGGIPDREAQAMGSAVMVKLERLRRETDGDQTHWVPYDPPRIERFLLTCAHVVTDTSAATGARSFGEVVAWSPGRSFRRWPADAAPRRGGQGIEDLGGQQVRPELGPNIVPDGDARETRSRACSDWVLLSFGPDPPAYVAQGQAVERWGDIDADDRDVSIVGYPGGSLGWAKEHAVSPMRLPGFHFERKDDGQGHIVLAGADETRPGMSGGGVFLADGALAGVHRAAFDPGMERHSVAAESILSWLAERGWRPPPELARTGSSSARLFVSLAALAFVSIAGAWWGYDAPEARVCVQVKIGERVASADGKPMLLQPLEGLQLSLRSDWMRSPALAPLTDKDGRACFAPVALKREDGSRAYPFRIYCDNAPAMLATYAPLMVSPHGVEADGRRRDPDPDLAGFVGANATVHLSAVGQATVQAAHLSAAVQSRDAAAGPQNLVDDIASAAQAQALTPAARDRAVDAWATSLQRSRPVLSASQWVEAGRPDQRVDRVRVVNAVGAYFEDGNRKATGFVVDERSVVVPAFAVDPSAKRRWMVFGDRPSDDASGHVELGEVQLGDAGIAGESRWRVAVVTASSRLPAAPEFSALRKDEAQGIAVIGFPARDARTPPSFQRALLAAYGVRSAMTGEAWRPERTARTVDHDATTMGGTAGAPVVDELTGAVVGMHLGGTFGQGLYKRNFAVGTPNLLAQIKNPLATSPSITQPVAETITDPLQLGSSLPRFAGYDGAFLGFPLALPEPSSWTARRHVGPALHYLHYSVVMHPSRRMALVAAANVDRSLIVRVPRDPDLWLLDPRIPPGAQPDRTLFDNNEIDRGHLISRGALAWGLPDIAGLAARSAFYWPNATPQHARLNQGAWARLEKRVFEELQPQSRRVSVFAGPVHDDGDWVYRGWSVPRRFWMVAVFSAPSTAANAPVHAFLVEQYRAGAHSSSEPEWLAWDDNAKEVRLEDIEQATGLQFPAAIRRSVK